MGLLVAVASCQSLEQPVGQIRHIENPAAEGARFPHLATLPDGGILMSWIETRNNGHVLKFAVYRHGHWLRQGEVSHGIDWFVNWADFPYVTAIDESFWVAYWLVRANTSNVYDNNILISVSTDAGISWSMPQSPYRDSRIASHGFVSIFPVESDAGMVWLDGRHELPHQSGGYSLRYARLYRDGSFDLEWVIDDRTCSCCRTAATVTTAGPVIAWRSRRDHEVRDHHIARLIQDKWSFPSPLSQEGWSIEGCPVNGPALAARKDHIVASWFTAEGNRSRVQAAFSSVNTMQFNQVFEVDDSQPAGRAMLAWLNDHAAVVIWLTGMNRVTKKANLAARTIFTDGTMSPIKRVIDISPGRDSGIPQLVKNGSGFMLAWTGAAPVYGVETRQLPIEILQQ